MKFIKIALISALFGFANMVFSEVTTQDLDQVQSLVDQLKEKLRSIKDQVQAGQVTEEAKERIKNKLQSISDQFDTLKNVATSEILNRLSRVQEAAQAAQSSGKNLSETFRGLGEKAREAASGIGESFRNIFS